VFATRTWHCRGEFAVTERAAQRADSTDEPKHQQRKSRLNLFQLKTESREDPGANDIGDHDRARSYKTDGPPGRCRLDRSRMCKRGHLSQMLLNCYRTMPNINGSTPKIGFMPCWRLSSTV